MSDEHRNFMGPVMVCSNFVIQLWFLFFI